RPAAASRPGARAAGEVPGPLTPGEPSAGLRLAASFWALASSLSISEGPAGVQPTPKPVTNAKPKARTRGRVSRRRADMAPRIQRPARPTPARIGPGSPGARWSALRGMVRPPRVRSRQGIPGRQPDHLHPRPDLVHAGAPGEPGLGRGGALGATLRFRRSAGPSALSDERRRDHGRLGRLRGPDGADRHHRAVSDPQHGADAAATA